MSQGNLFDAAGRSILHDPALDDVVQAAVDRYGFDPVEAALGRIKIQMAGPVPQIGERSDDQRTSKGRRSADVRRFSATSYAGRLLAVFGRNAGRDDYSFDGLTDYDATVAVVGEPGVACAVSQFEGCRRRCSDLRDAGYLADTGREHDERILWGITPQGEAALQRLRTTGWSR